MKFSREAFDAIIAAPQYVGADTYLLDDKGKKVKYHIYVCIVESGNVAAILCEKMPANNDPEKYELYEFNGNKLLEHNVVRIKPLDKNSNRAVSLTKRFTEKTLFYTK